MSGPRRTLGIAVVAALAALTALVWLRSRPPPPPDPAPVPMPVPDQLGSNAIPAHDPGAASWRARAAHLAELCDVDAHTVCSDTACATVAWLPDLDSLRGWASLGWSNPGLFAVSVLGDVGIAPPGGWPCNEAIGEFFSGVAMYIAIGDGPRGTWVVCASSSGDAATNEALCARTAADLGLPWTGPDSNHHL